MKELVYVYREVAAMTTCRNEPPTLEELNGIQPLFYYTKQPLMVSRYFEFVK